MAISDNIVYVSWNGATEVATWALFGGDDSSDFDSLVLIGNTTKNDFETAIALDTNNLPNFVSVLGIASNGIELGRTGVCFLCIILH